MAETLAEIESGLDAERRGLERDVDELGERLKDAVDWRARVERSPGTAVAVAAGAGAVLAMALGRRRARPVASSAGNGAKRRRSVVGRAVSALTSPPVVALVGWLSQAAAESSAPARRREPVRDSGVSGGSG